MDDADALGEGAGGGVNGIGDDGAVALDVSVLFVLFHGEDDLAVAGDLGEVIVHGVGELRANMIHQGFFCRCR